jgi:hypothetical protein
MFLVDGGKEMKKISHVYDHASGRHAVGWL